MKVEKTVNSKTKADRSIEKDKVNYDKKTQIEAEIEEIMHKLDVIDNLP